MYSASTAKILSGSEMGWVLYSAVYIFIAHVIALFSKSEAHHQMNIMKIYLPIIHNQIKHKHVENRFERLPGVANTTFSNNTHTHTHTLHNIIIIYYNGIKCM